jgi:hypothetical protein
MSNVHSSGRESNAPCRLRERGRTRGGRGKGAVTARDEPYSGGGSPEISSSRPSPSDTPTLEGLTGSEIKWKDEEPTAHVEILSISISEEDTPSLRKAPRGCDTAVTEGSCSDSEEWAVSVDDIGSMTRLMFVDGWEPSKLSKMNKTDSFDVS